MASGFQLNALQLIRARVPLDPSEFAVLQILIHAAENGVYWDTLSRVRASHEDADLVILNIAGKAKFAGLTPELEKLRDDHLADVRHHVSDGPEAVG